MLYMYIPKFQVSDDERFSVEEDMVSSAISNSLPDKAVIEIDVVAVPNKLHMSCSSTYAMYVEVYAGVLVLTPGTCSCEGTADRTKVGNTYSKGEYQEAIEALLLNTEYRSTECRAC